MGITFETIPTTQRNPLFFVEVGDPKGTGSAVKTTAIIGQRITGKGTGTTRTAITRS